MVGLFTLGIFLGLSLLTGLVKKVLVSATPGYLQDQLAHKGTHHISSHNKTRMVEILGFLQVIFVVTVALVSPSILPVGAAFILLAGFFGTVFLWLPSRSSGRYSKWLARQLLPFMTGLETQLRPILRWLHKVLKTRSQKPILTDISSPEDLASLIRRQKQAKNNQIDLGQLDQLLGLLNFSKKPISEFMTRIRKIRHIGDSEAIGPVLINELHQTGLAYFPVEEEFNNEIIGTLNLFDLIGLKKTGSVKDAMNPTLYYVNEKNMLNDVVSAFFKTGSHVFLVVNGEKKIVGIINIEQTLKELLGDDLADEFDLYESLDAVSDRDI